MIFSVVAILIFLYSFVNYKHSFFLFVIFQSFAYLPNVSLGGSMRLSLAMLLIGLYTVEFYFKRSCVRHSNTAFPYKIPMVLIGFSLIFTCFFAVAGFVPEITRAVSIIVQTLVEIWLIWELAENERDFKFIFQGIIILFIVATTYGLYEYLISSNPFLNYKIKISDGEIRTYLNTGSQGLRGYRVYSVFNHPIGAGMNFGLFFIFVLSCCLVYNDKIPKKTLAFIAAALCVPCIILSKMRAAIFFTAIAALMFVDWRMLKKKRFYLILLIGVVGAFAVYPLIQKNINILLSFFDSSAQSKIQGSNVSMRFSQLDAVYHLMMMSPIGGLGEKFEDFIVNQYTIASLDYESIWFEQMTRHGLVGVLVQIVLIYVSIVRLPQKYRSKPLFFLNLSYWLTYTLSSTPSFSMPMFYLSQFYFIKKTEIYKIENKKIRIKRGLKKIKRRQCW